MYKHWVEYQTVKVFWNDMDYIAKVKIYWSYDPDYGSDRDGNRGVPKDHIDKTEIQEVIEIFGALIDPVPEVLAETINEAIE